MKAIELGLLYVIAATSLLLSVAAAQPVSDSTRVYASLPSRIEINVPTQHENLQLQNCTPANQISVTGSVEVKSNLDWNLDVAGSTSDGRMHGTGTHELHDPMTVSALVPSSGPVAVPGTESSPPSSALLSNVAPGDYSGSSAIGLTFGQLFEWDDYADDSYQLTVTLTAGPA
jgi:hypothetical protein